MFDIRQQITDSIVRKILKSLSKYNKNIPKVVSNNSPKYFPDYYRSSHNSKALEYLERNSLYSPDQHKYEHKKPNIGNKKVALCLHGFLRTYNKTYNSCLKNIIDIYNPDIFIFAPKTVGSYTGDISKVNCSHDNNIIASEDEVVEKYGGKKLVKSVELWDYNDELFIEKAKSFNLPKSSVFNRSPARILSFFYHIKKSIELKRKYEEENNINYDIVIRARPDLAFYSPFILDKKSLNNLENTVYSNSYARIVEDHCKILADSSPIPPFLNVQRGEMLSAGELFFNDLISVTNSKNADILSTAYDKIHLYHERGVSLTNEALMAYHIIFENKLNVDIRDFVKLCIFRDDAKEITNADNIIKEMGYHEFSNLHF